MTIQESLDNITLVSGADISAYNRRFVSLSSGAVVGAGEGESAIGILQDNPNTAGQAATVAVGGIARVESGEAFAAGKQLTPDTLGRAVEAASGENIAAIALEPSLEAGQIISVLFNKTGSRPPVFFWLDRSTPSGVSMFITLDAGDVVYVSWGDGTSESVAQGILSHAYLYPDNYALHFTGDVARLRQIGLNNQGLIGNIDNIALLTDLEGLLVASNNLIGDISDLDTLASLETLDIADNIGIVGSLSDVTPLTALTDLRLDGTSIDGDIGDLAPLVNLTATLHLFGLDLTYTTTTLPSWDNTEMLLYSCGLSTAEVDQFLIDLNAGGGSNGTLHIAGTNEARSSASDAAVTALEGRGWTVTVNE